MTTKVNVRTAKDALPRLIDAACAGEPVVILRGQRAVARLTALRDEVTPDAAVNATAARVQFSKHLAMVEAGKIVALMRGNQPVALLEPVEQVAPEPVVYRLPRRNAYYRAVWTRLWETAKTWEVDASEIAVTFVQNADSRAPEPQTYYELRAPDGRSRFIRNGKDAPMPPESRLRHGVSHGRQFTSQRRLLRKIGPFQVEQVIAMMKACPDYYPSPSEMAAE